MKHLGPAIGREQDAATPSGPLLSAHGWTERLWSKVDRRSTDECWLWTASTAGAAGYGRLWRNGKAVRAHRLVYELLVGPIPAGLELDHLCRNRPCVNPAHLEPVSGAENLRRGEGFGGTNARKTHCPRGHEYTRLIERTGPRRRCRTCSNELRAIAKAAFRAANGLRVSDGRPNDLSRTA